MTRDSILREFAAMINEMKGINPAILFKKLARYNLQRVELMIMDSAIKGMALDTLDKTLLLTEENYIIALQKLTLVLVDLYNILT